MITGWELYGKVGTPHSILMSITTSRKPMLEFIQGSHSTFQIWLRR